MKPFFLKASRFLLIILAAGLAAQAAETGTDSPEQRGLEIAREADRRDEGWKTSTADLTMILENKQGEQATRKIRVKALEVPDDGDKSLMIFDTPEDVRGTVFLSVAHAARDDDQWIYLPALKRVKRIASATKGGSFVGSEFSYEDLSPPVVDKYTYKHFKDENFQGRAVFVMERYPKDAYSLYSKHVIWMDKEYYIPWQVEYYDKAGAKAKSLTLKRYKKHLDKFWRAGEVVMENHANGKKTALIWENFTFRQGVEERDFDPERLEQSR